MFRTADDARNACFDLQECLLEVLPNLISDPLSDEACSLAAIGIDRLELDVPNQVCEHEVDEVVRHLADGAKYGEILTTRPVAERMDWGDYEGFPWNLPGHHPVRPLPENRRIDLLEDIEVVQLETQA